MTPEEFAKEIKVAAKAYLDRSPDEAGVWFFIEEAEILIERWREAENKEWLLPPAPFATKYPCR